MLCAGISVVGKGGTQTAGPIPFRSCGFCLQCEDGNFATGLLDLLHPAEALESCATLLQTGELDIRVLIVIGSLDLGGTEMHLLQVLPKLAKSGFSIAVYTLSKRGNLASTLDALGVPVVGSTVSPCGRGMFWRFLCRAIRGSWSAFGLVCYYWKFRPDIVHFFLPEAYLVGAPLSFATFGATRVMSRRSLNEYQKKHPILAVFERRLHKRMDALIGNAQVIVDQLAAEGAPPERLHLIYNGVDMARLDTITDVGLTRRELSLDADTLVLICVANLIPYKGHADLLEALALVHAELRRPWVALCAGRDDGTYGDALREHAIRIGLSKQIRFLGERSDVPNLLKASNIGVLCSHEEGFPNAALEAMACGLPFVATSVGGLREVIEHEGNGMLVPPRDPIALGRAILTLAHDPQLRSRLGAAAQKSVRTRFDLATCVEQYKEVYALAARERSRRGGERLRGRRPDH